MRVLSILMLSFLLLNLFSCKSQKANPEMEDAKKGEKVLLKIDSIKGIAKKLYLLTNSKLEVSDSNGSTSYKIVESEDTNVLQFSYEKDLDKVAYDGGYREEVVFEVPSTVSESNYTDGELQDTKMLFGRYCFCRGKTGLYKVTQGTLQVKLSKKEIHFKLKFKINEVPQVTTEVVF